LNYLEHSFGGFIMENEDKGMLDAVQEKLISRKLLVFAVATALMYFSDLSSDTWGMIAITYIGGQTAIDFAKAWRNG
tara:strand:- start:6964 stop:7194 length:231 start_codon:yes stop_codon:yes gene_type:complete